MGPGRALIQRVLCYHSVGFALQMKLKVRGVFLNFCVGKGKLEIHTVKPAVIPPSRACNTHQQVERENRRYWESQVLAQDTTAPLLKRQEEDFRTPNGSSVLPAPRLVLYSRFP